MLAPKSLRAYILDSATLEWRISPTIRIFLPLRSPKFSVKEKQSSKACVGCSWAPSPAFIIQEFV